MNRQAVAEPWHRFAQLERSAVFGSQDETKWLPMHRPDISGLMFAYCVDAQRNSDCLRARERVRTVEQEQQHQDGLGPGATARTPDRDISRNPDNDTLVIPDAGGGVARQADEARDTGASQPLTVGDAQRAASAPADGDREGSSRFQDAGPSR